VEPTRFLSSASVFCANLFEDAVTTGLPISLQFQNRDVLLTIGVGHLRVYPLHRRC
jgi:hypothetical protein